jgi:hypothetical protein
VPRQQLEGEIVASIKQLLQSRQGGSRDNGRYSREDSPGLQEVIEEFEQAVS